MCDPVRQEMLGAIGKNFEQAKVILFDRINTEEKMSLTDKIVKLTNDCIRLHGLSGNVKSYEGWDGKVRIRINLIVPKDARGSGM